jgi:hypothetical protein
MHFFGLVFWSVALYFVFRAFRSRSGCGSSGVWRDRRLDGSNNVDEQQSYIESLESRVAELENRLDFTERLVADKR